MSSITSSVSFENPFTLAESLMMVEMIRKSIVMLLCLFSWLDGHSRTKRCVFPDSSRLLSGPFFFSSTFFISYYFLNKKKLSILLGPRSLGFHSRAHSVAIFLQMSDVDRTSEIFMKFGL